MSVGRAQAAKRSLVKVLLALAVVYNVKLLITRDSPDADVVKAYKKVILKTHPDKGGAVADQQKVQGAKTAWDDAKKDAAEPGRPNQGRGQMGRERGTREDRSSMV